MCDPLPDWADRSKGPSWALYSPGCEDPYPPDSPLPAFLSRPSLLIFLTDSSPSMCTLKPLGGLRPSGARCSLRCWEAFSLLQQQCLLTFHANQLFPEKLFFKFYLYKSSFQYIQLSENAKSQKRNMDNYTQEGDSFPCIPSRDWSCLDELTFLNVFAGSHGRWHGRASVGRSMDSHFLIYFFPSCFAPPWDKAKGSLWGFKWMLLVAQNTYCQTKTRNRNLI